MALFNHESRRKNVVRSAAVSGICDATSMLLGFGYRMAFLRVLTVQYLGINGLFTNILGVLGLAELGVTGAIVYRLYQPLSEEDVDRVGHIMRFFRTTYLAIAATILALGLCLVPFLDLLIKDVGEVPADVNLRVVFLLFLVQTSSTYLFSYKTALLTADQRYHQTTIIATATIVVRYTAQLVTLFVSKDYTLTLAAGIVVTVLANWLASMWVTMSYPQVFRTRGSIDGAERHDILRDTSAAMMHKVGGTVLTSTDSILLSKFVGIATAGVFSNYELVLWGAQRVVYSVFGGFTPTLGNAHVELSKRGRYDVFRKANFANFALVGLLTCCLYALTDDFICLWLGTDMLLDRAILTWLCVRFYLECVRQVAISYTNACGLFVRDKVRPLIESILNLTISVVAMQRFGAVGVVVGTVASLLLTVFWREPYLLYTYAFGVKLAEYWKDYARHVAVVVLSAAGLRFVMTSAIGPVTSLMQWLLCGILGVIVYCTTFVLMFHADELFLYYRALALARARGIMAGRDTSFDGKG